VAAANIQIAANAATATLMVPVLGAELQESVTLRKKAVPQMLSNGLS
jgi:hypothetical protein